jgi:hypothetical protein
MYSRERKPTLASDAFAQFAWRSEKSKKTSTNTSEIESVAVLLAGAMMSSMDFTIALRAALRYS